MRGSADGVELDHPALGRAPREDVGHDVFRAQRLERGAGTRVAAAHERERDVELLAAHVHLALQGGELVAGHQLEMPVGEGARRREAGSRGVELGELQLDALGDRARADAGRIELLDDGERAQGARGIGRRLAGDGLDDRVQRLGQVAVVVDRVHDRARDRERRGRQPRELELPQEVVAQRAARFVGELELALAGTGPGRLGFRSARLGPVVADLDHGFGGFAAPLVAVLGRRGRRLARRCIERPGRFEVLVRLEHHVGLERLQHLGLQFDRRQLQQADGLLQLRRHRQLLPDPELEAGLHHAAEAPGAGNGIKGTVPFNDFVG